MKPLFILLAWLLVGLSGSMASGKSKFSLDRMGEDAAMRRFSVRMFDHVRRQNPGNAVCSPLSVMMLFRMLQDGGDSTLNRQLQQAMGVSPEVIRAIAHDNAPTPGASPKNTTLMLNIANLLAINREQPIQDQFAYLAREHYDTEVQHIAFDGGTLQHINNWVERQTHGLIPSALNSLAPQAMMYALSTVYFKGTWKDAFETGDTGEADFTTATGKTIKVPMMHDVQTLNYGEHPSFQFVRMPYKPRGDKKHMRHFSLLVLLPTYNHTIDHIMDYLGSHSVGELLAPSYPYAVDIHLPSFDTLSDIDVLALLRSMGVTQLSDLHRNHFPGISPVPLAISESRQTARLRLNEKETEAAAVTRVFAIGAFKPNPERESRIFNANHPFVYLLINDDTNTIFFMGQYTGGEAEPLEKAAPTPASQGPFLPKAPTMIVLVVLLSAAEMRVRS